MTEHSLLAAGTALCDPTAASRLYFEHLLRAPEWSGLICGSRRGCAPISLRSTHGGYMLILGLGKDVEQNIVLARETQDSYASTTGLAGRLQRQC